jgi:phosphatidylinositol alpha-1,6-mannosyltransferase
MVLVEAQACGKAVIAGDSGGTRETMLVGESGLVVDCSEAGNIANAILHLIAQGDLISNLGHTGREHVKTNLDWPVHTIEAKKLFS